MGRYSRNYSKYILRKKHQLTNKGAIFERDWMTIGERERLSPGKTPYFKNGNFLFTASNVPTFQRKRNSGEFVAHWGYDDVSSATDVVNRVRVNEDSDSLGDYAYFGSAVELVKATINGIILDYPAAINWTYSILGRQSTPYDETIITSNYYILDNPFNINMHNRDVVLTPFDNPLRYMSFSYEDYVVSLDDGETWYNVYGYGISKWMGDEDCKTNDFYGLNPVLVVTIALEGVDDGLSVYIFSSRDGYIYTVKCDADDNDEITPKVIIKPKDSVINEYFNNLEGFDKKLLNVSSKPRFRTRLLTPYETDRGLMFRVRYYSWPTNGYNLDIESSGFNNYVNSLIECAQLYDDYLCDNLYQKMTHEAIKNYDWSYTRYIDEDEAEKNFYGGSRVEKQLKIYGSLFDELKRHIDGIKLMKNVTYSGQNNMPSALLSDELSNCGWDVRTIISNNEYDMSISIDDEFKNEYGVKWYPTLESNDITRDITDKDFMNRMILNSKHILRSKGTVQSIDMIMGMFGFGGEDYTVTENYYTTEPKLATDDLLTTITNINIAKATQRFSDHTDYPDYDGLTLGNVYIGNTMYVVPYYNQNKMYDGNICFQSKGGWGRYVELKRDYGYSETYPYMREMANMTALLSINPFSVSVGDVYYVHDLSDYINYAEMPAGLTNFFMVEEPYYIASLSGWKNISMFETDEDTDIYKKVRYLEGIIPETRGNNPHVGFGKYDDGDEYVDTMKQPFKYALDNHMIEPQYLTAAEQFTYNVETKASQHTINGSVVDSKVVNNINESNDIYYLNSKVITFRNNINSRLYKDYFKEVILPYLMQVIPSTAILKLENIN